MMLSVNHIIVLLLLKCWYVFQSSLQGTLSQRGGCSFLLINKLFKLFLKILWSLRMRKVYISLIYTAVFVGCIQKLHVLLLMHMWDSIINSSMIGTSYLVCILNVCVDVTETLGLIGLEFSHLRERSVYHQSFERIIKIDTIIKT
jgi:hypothetical protein